LSILCHVPNVACVSGVFILCHVPNVYNPHTQTTLGT
jgi:hypothetical protein